MPFDGTEFAKPSTRLGVLLVLREILAGQKDSDQPQCGKCLLAVASRDPRLSVVWMPSVVDRQTFEVACGRIYSFLGMSSNSLFNSDGVALKKVKLDTMIERAVARSAFLTQG